LIGDKGGNQKRDFRMTEKVVLIADDDRDLVDALALRCGRLGLKALCAYDGFSALSLIKSERPDMACLDVDMPAGNGLCVCEMVASDETCRSIPIAILTGRSDPDTIMRCHSLCAYYVEKCPDVWSRIEPLLKELLLGSETTSAGPLGNGLGPASHAPLPRKRSADSEAQSSGSDASALAQPASIHCG
jgi:CheY-like chemotaxis protein